MNEEYFNLLVSADSDAWEGGQGLMHRGRVFEYTADQVRALFKVHDEINFEALKALPSVFAYENIVGKPAIVGTITGIQHRQDGWGVTFAPMQGVKPIPHEVLVYLRRKLDIADSWELDRTHWAVKNVNLGLVLRNADLLYADSLGGVPKRPPTAFISYSWDSNEHIDWVKQLALDLRRNGVDVILDKWIATPGQNLTRFMEQSLADCDFAIAVCTERYAEKVASGEGGASYEQVLMAGLVVGNADTTKIIPVVRQSTRPPIMPAAMKVLNRIDMSRPENYQSALDELVWALHEMPPPLPPLGQPPARLL